MRLLKLIIIVIIFGSLGYGIWYGVKASDCPDSDFDGLSDCEELTLYHTEMYNPDTDGDGYSDGEEIDNGFSPHYGINIKLSEVDSDGDGLMDDTEIKEKTNLMKEDSDGDGVNDFMEVENGGDPTNDKVTESRLNSLQEKLIWRKED